MGGCAHVELRCRIDHRDCRVAPPAARDRQLVREAPAPTRRDIERPHRRLCAREHPLEVTRPRAVPDSTPGRGDGRRGVVYLHRHARGEDRACSGRDEGAREVGGELCVQEGREGVGRVGCRGERGVGDSSSGPDGECDGGDAFLGGFCSCAPVGIAVVSVAGPRMKLSNLHCPRMYGSGAQNICGTCSISFGQNEHILACLLPMLGPLMTKSGGEQKISGASVCIP